MNRITNSVQLVPGVSVGDVLSIERMDDTRRDGEAEFSGVLITFKGGGTLLLTWPVLARDVSAVSLRQQLGI